MIVNQSREPQLVDVVNLDTKKRTSVRIMPRGRVDLPSGFIVDPNWDARNPGVLVKPKVKPEPTKSSKKQPTEVQTRS